MYDYYDNWSRPACLSAVGGTKPNAHPYDEIEYILIDLFTDKSQLVTRNNLTL